MPVNSSRVAVSTQLCLSKLAPREALEPLQVQTFGLQNSRSTYAKINLRPDSESVFLIESVLLKFTSIKMWGHQKVPSLKVFGHLKMEQKGFGSSRLISWNENPWLEWIKKRSNGIDIPPSKITFTSLLFNHESHSGKEATWRKNQNRNYKQFDCIVIELC